MKGRLPALAALLFASPLLVGCLGAADEPLAGGDVPAAAQPDGRAWANLDEAVVRPGVLIHTPARACPSNFLFVRPDNTSVFLGTTAACMADVPVGGLVTVGGMDVLGFLAYSSWQTMDEVGEKDPDAREYNDFAVVKIDEAYRHLVNPTMLHYGGPLGLANGSDAGLGDVVKTYTNGTSHQGLVSGRAGDWAVLVHEAPPTLPGAMGRGALTQDGLALGVVVNLGVVPNPGANGVARLDTLMAYARDHAKLYMDLVTADPLDPALLAQPPLGDLPPLPGAAGGI
jgi:hypothetical protein